MPQASGAERCFVYVANVERTDRALRQTGGVVIDSTRFLHIRQRQHSKLGLRTILGTADVQMKELETYTAFRRLKNFACVKQQQKDLQVWVKLDPSSVTLEKDFTRDVRDIGHAGTGDLEIRIENAADLKRAQPLLLRSYQGA